MIGASQFDAYGNRIASTDSSTDPYSGFGVQMGYYTDAETGLQLLSFRYYDPSAGRFVNRDPIGYLGGLNVYRYAANNPVSFDDPLGLQEGEGEEGQGGEAGVGGQASGGGSPGFQYPGGYVGAGDPQFSELQGYQNELQAEGFQGNGGTLDPTDVPANSDNESQASETPDADTAGNEKPSKHGTVPDEAIVVRGGQSPLPPPGTVFSGSHGETLEQAAAGVQHGTIRFTTAGEIRATGGTVSPEPELTRAGNMNEQHVNITEGDGPSTFSDMFQNPVPKASRIK